jgi:hypothetical protein
MYTLVIVHRFYFNVLGNLAYGKPTNQRSTYWKYKSGLAVDGDQEGDCATAMPVEPNAGEVWFHIDLLAEYEIDKLVVVNKRDCKSAYQFLISNSCLP